MLVQSYSLKTLQILVDHGIDLSVLNKYQSPNNKINKEISDLLISYNVEPHIIISMLTD